MNIFKNNLYVTSYKLLVRMYCMGKTALFLEYRLPGRPCMG